MNQTSKGSVIFVSSFLGAVLGFAICMMFFPTKKPNVNNVVLTNPYQKWQDSINPIFKANQDTIKQLRKDVEASKDRVKTNHKKQSHENKQIDHFTFSTRQHWHDSVMRTNGLR